MSKVLQRPVESTQYAAKDYRKKLQARGITVSMSRRGDCWDNAPMESCNATLKVECVNDARFATREQARQTIGEYIGYYNTERRHSSLGNIAPAEFERRWHAGLNATAQALLPQAALRYPSAAGSRFVASDRTGRPWITLIVASWRLLNGDRFKHLFVSCLRVQVQGHAVVDTGDCGKAAQPLRVAVVFVEHGVNDAGGHHPCQQAGAEVVSRLRLLRASQLIGCRGTVPPLGHGLGVDAVAPGQRPQAFLTTL